MRDLTQDRSNDRVLEVALNGASDHPATPRTPKEIAEDAAACVAAGANLIHVHAFNDDGVETLDEAAVARAIEAVRHTCPGVPISMTTFAEIEPDPSKRLADVAGWSLLPDLIPANQGEEGIVELTEFFIRRGVAVQACVFTVAQAEAFVRRGNTEQFRRVVVEPMEDDPATACEHALAMEEVLATAGVRLEQVQHGMGTATWPVLRQAVARGHGTRIGLEDTPHRPDGTVVTGNVELVRAAFATMTNAGTDR